MLHQIRPLPPMALAALFALTLTVSAQAREAHCQVPMADWQPREAVKEMAQQRGLTVRRIKIDDGCYEVDARDANGHAIELRLDPATLAVLAPDDEHEEDD